MPKLIVQDGDRIHLVDLGATESFLLGRSARCDFPCSARRASRRHLEIVPGEGGHLVRDLGSTNGTTLNGAPFAGAVKLRDGDRLDAGGCIVTYRSTP